jgi:molybdenum cofactor cytidylyltransferase
VSVPNPYSATLMAHFRAPRNRGSLTDPTIAQEGTNPLCGDRVRIELLVEQGIVRDARFSANACAICIASASMLTDLVKKAPLDEVETLTVHDLLKSLKARIPAARMNCVSLPLTVLHTGVHRYRKQQAPWKESAPGRQETAEVRRARAVAAIVLAAGEARRFGAQKLLAPFGDSTVIRQVVERVRASRVSRVIVVVGTGAAGIRAALSDLDVECRENGQPERGMSSSIAAGVAALPPNVGAALVVLGDQPTVSGSVLDRLVEAWWNGTRAIVAPRYRGRRGNPVLFDRALFPELRALTGDKGGRDLIDAHPGQLDLVDFDDASPLDIDTPADYDALLRAHRLKRAT